MGSIAFGLPLAVVDGNVIRVLSRLLALPGNPLAGPAKARVWEAANGRELLMLKGHSAMVGSVAFSPDGQRIVTGSDDQTAKVWEAVSGRELVTLKGHSAGILSVAFSSDGQRIVTGSEDQTAKVWEAVRGGQLLTFKGHTAPIWSAALQVGFGGALVFATGIFIGGS